MPRPIEIPGTIGALAKAMGLQNLASAMSTDLAQTHPGTLRKWGRNLLKTPGPAGALLAKLAHEHEITPTLFESKGLPTSYVASLPDGWVMFGARTGGWGRRTPYHGGTDSLTVADRGATLSARLHGWPW